MSPYFGPQITDAAWHRLAVFIGVMALLAAIGAWAIVATIVKHVHVAPPAPAAGQGLR